MITVEIGQCLLQQILEQKRMQQLELAYKTGLSTSQISEYVTNRTKMSLKNARLISYVLNCQIEDLYEFRIQDK